MSKKKKHEDDEELDNFEEISDETSDLEESNEDEVSEDSGEISILSDDSDDLEIVLEISDEEGSEGSETESEDEVVLSKHKVQGKHSLKYDSIFKGKKEDKVDEDFDQTSMYFNEKFEVDKSSFFYVESQDNEFYVRQKNVKEKHLENDGFTNIELFNELSVYFSDNLFNMFKLLDNKWRNLIITELQDHIGKNKNSKEITNRNIYIGTELEFSHIDPLGSSRVYTGVVLETDYQESIFKIDSYENVYEVHITSIIRILNNSKFKYNLNKLNNIDFL